MLIRTAARVLSDSAVVWAASLDPRRDARDQMLGSVAALYAHGARADWAALCRGRGGRLVTLPTYPFERAPYGFTGAAHDGGEEGSTP